MPPTRRGTVLVIDDDRVIRMVVREALENAGHRVIEAADGIAGIGLAAAELPDVVILDIMLPRVDGLSLLAELRAAAGPAARILVFSATGSRNAGRAAALGAHDYLSKPFELRDLVARVNRLADPGLAA